MDSKQTLSLDDIKAHNSPEDCWIVVGEKVWDVTDFLSVHPGGSEVILKYAGGDATEAYNEIHAPGMLEETLEEGKFIGDLLPSSDVPPSSTIEEAVEAENSPPRIQTKAQVPIQIPHQVPDVYEKPHLHSLISAADFREVAKHTLTPKAWAFYSSAATDLVTYTQNKALIRRVMIRPRILRDVKHVSTKRKILGCDSDVPFFISPAAMARLAHPDGECALARGSGNEGIVQCISSNASYPLSAIVKSGKKDQPFFLQLYVNSDRSKTAELLKKAAALGIKGVFVTVDAPVPGKREADERIAAEAVASAISGAVASNDKKGGGMGRLMAQYVEKSLIWKDIQWIKDVSGLPVVLKGVQSAADAILASEFGASGVMLSNHGGRSLDGAQPSILVLLELHRICPDIFDKLDIYIDGGFERGSDILKAIALGATAVGIGRPYLYSLTYGQEGVEHITQILKDELETSLRLCGLTDINQAHPGLINTQDIDHMVATSSAHPYIQWRPRAKM
ncbi:cytochrome b2 [Aaosphaeria arxii CBS 175.79]|uniref:L-lactate dehydrogenase (cytochrome) n=1 Tax=Aaosphaeria arxii CBS 175.79 TaxID=1450172 RepID=A0A6A5XXX7_9PLEO|nr:cytochrome b2 [Aaosphaeria arxii CBS 175.79]KAF2017490.1 cytochrome b2 [Aaosphaeria arxii CBS 175.79]